jgi:hypothetical protein
LLLHDVFDYGYDEVAEIVGTSVGNARQLAPRARRQVADQRPRFDPSEEQRAQLAHRFFAAARDGDLEGLEALLAHDVVLHGDGGGKVPALARAIGGRNRVARTLRAWTRQGLRSVGLELRETVVNGQPGAMFIDSDGGVFGVMGARHRRRPDPGDPLDRQPRQARSFGGLKTQRARVGADFLGDGPQSATPSSRASRTRARRSTAGEARRGFAAPVAARRFRGVLRPAAGDLRHRAPCDAGRIGVAASGHLRPGQLGDVGDILFRNSLVLALHGFACVAGFIAGSSVPMQAEQHSGWKRTLHDRAGQGAILFVMAATLFSLGTQAYVLGARRRRWPGRGTFRRGCCSPASCRTPSPS